MPKRLAEIVMDAGLAGRQDVVKAAQIADREKAPLIVALVRHRGVDELALVAAIKRQVRVAMADPAQVEHDPEAIRELSRDTCWRLRVVPLQLSVYEAGPRSLRLAMADPTDAVAIAEVEHLTGCQVETALMPLSAIEELVEEAYRSFVTEVMPRKQAGARPDSKSPDKGSRRQAKPGGKNSAKTPYGGALKVTTEPMARADGVPAADSAADSAETKPSTVPYHRVTDEAGPELRLQALLDLLYKKELITRDEYEAEVRALMKQRTGQG